MHLPAIFKKFAKNVKLLPWYVQIFLILVIVFGSSFRILNLTGYGYYFDIIYTQYNWGKAGYEMGLFGFWRDYTGFFDYSFLSLFLETVMYSISLIFGGSPAAFAGVLKSFNWIVEIVFAWYIYRIVYQYSPEKNENTKNTKAFLIAGLSYIAPSLWFVSGVWGQNDTLIALLSAFALEIIYWNVDRFNLIKKLPENLFLKNYAEILNDKFFWSGVIVALAFWIKQQAILIVPILILYHLRGKKWRDIFGLALWSLPYLVLIKFGFDFYTSFDWLSIFFITLALLLLLFFTLLYYLAIDDHWKHARRQLFAFLVVSLAILIPCAISNYTRTGSTIFAVIGRQNVPSNGAANLWRLLDITGDAGRSLFIINNTGYVTIGAVGLVIYILIMLGLLFSFERVRLPISKNFKFENIFHRAIKYQDAVIITTISSGAYFIFFTKMHSRYLHFLIIFSLLSLAVININKNFYRWLIFTILIHLSYFLNQIGVYNGQENVSPRWVPDLLNMLNTQYWDYWKFSSLVTLLCFISLVSVSKDIFAEKTE